MGEKLDLSIHVGYNKDSATKNLKSLLEELQNNQSLKLNIDSNTLKSLNGNFVELTKTIKEISNQMHNAFNTSTFNSVNQALDNTNKKIQSAKDKMNGLFNLNSSNMSNFLSKELGDLARTYGELQLQVQKTLSDSDFFLSKDSLTLDKNGDINGAVMTYKDKLGTVIQETFTLKDVTDDLGKVIGQVFESSGTTKLTENYQAQQKYYEKLAKEQQKIAQAQEKAQQKQQQQAEKLANTQITMMNKVNEGVKNGWMSPEKGTSYIEKIASMDLESATLGVKKLNQEFKDLKSTFNSNDSNMTSAINNILKINNVLNSGTDKINKALSQTPSMGRVSDFNQYQQSIDGAIKEMQRLKNMQEALKKGEVIPSQLITSQVQRVNNALKEMNNTVKEVSTNAGTMSSALKQMATSFGFFNIVQTGMNAIRSSFQEGMEAVKMMDKTITTLTMTMDGLSKNDLSNMGSRAQQMAVDLSSTSNDVLEAVQTFANANEKIDDIFAKTKSAITLSNLTGLSTFDTVNLVQSIGEQFDDLADNTEASSVKVTDSIIGISKALSMDFAYGVKQMSNSVILLGSLANQVGMDVDETLSMISTGMEKMELTGSEMATALN